MAPFSDVVHKKYNFITDMIFLDLLYSIAETLIRQHNEASCITQLVLISIAMSICIAP